MAQFKVLHNRRLPYRMYPLGDAALVVEFGHTIDPAIFEVVQAFSKTVAAHPFPGFLEQVPAFTTVTLFYNPCQVNVSGPASPYEGVEAAVEALLLHVWQSPGPAAPPRQVRIPVCYGGAYGPDLRYVAEVHGLSEDEVVTLHTQQEYLVYMIGFAPGFPYLGGLNEIIATPRKATPRAVIPAGSVGIAGAQTGVYPLPTPGGWQLIGRTPLALFRPDHAQPSLLQAGDVVRFYKITEADFLQWKEEEDAD